MEIISVNRVTDQIVSHITLNNSAELGKLLVEHLFNSDGESVCDLPDKERVTVYHDDNLVIFVGHNLLDVMNEVLSYGDSYFGEYEEESVPQCHPEIVVSMPIIKKEAPVVPFKKEMYAKEKPRSSNRGVYGRLRRNKDNV